MAESGGNKHKHIRMSQANARGLASEANRKQLAAAPVTVSRVCCHVFCAWTARVSSSATNSRVFCHTFCAWTTCVTQASM